MAETAMLRDSLNQLDVVSERVAKMETLESGELGLVLNGQAGLFNLFSPGGDVVDLVRLVRPRRATIDIFLDAHVHLELTGVEPEPVALEHRRSRDLLHAEKAEVKLPGLFQLGLGDVHL